MTMISHKPQSTHHPLAWNVAKPPLEQIENSFQLRQTHDNLSGASLEPY
jgi:hypothetical protein